MEPTPEKRNHARLPFATRCEVVAGGNAFATALIDISLKGALVEAPAGWSAPPGAPCELRITLADSQVRLVMGMEVAHAHPVGLGLHCVSIDLESVTHLRRLLELNFGDPALVERELALLG